MGQRSRGAEEQRKIINAQCPMPNAQCPMPNAQCPMPNAQLIQNSYECYS
ncbi:MAG: histidine kinase [Nostoc sp.]